MKKLIIIIALLFTASTAQAAPNYSYTMVQPNETYANNTTQTQYIMTQEQLSQVQQMQQAQQQQQQTLNNLNNFYYGGQQVLTQNGTNTQSNAPTYEGVRNGVQNSLNIVNDINNTYRTIQSLFNNY